jgi:hypothetical protein
MAYQFMGMHFLAMLYAIKRKGVYVTFLLKSQWSIVDSRWSGRLS